MNEKELEELEIYLEDEDNNSIYQELTKTDYAGLFDPLEFFRLLYSQLEFIEINVDKPLFLIQTLKDLNLDSKQKIVFFDYVLWSLNNTGNDDRNFRIFRRQFEKLIDELKKGNEKAEILKQDAQFEEALNHLETLSNNREKISYLKQVKAEYEKIKTTWEDFSGLTIDKKCELEIERLKSLEVTQSINRKKNVELDEKLNDRKKDKDLTLDRAVLLFNYLLNYAKVNAHNTEKAEFISFLTGFSKNTIVQKLSRLHEKADLNFVSYEKDMEIVRRYFEKLHLSEITKAIDNDLENY